jgi:aspartate-semialdehyde dehydrogenase
VVLDDPENALHPLATDASGRDDVFVGRLRRDPSHERGLCMWIVADNLRKGTALNAIQFCKALH